MATILALKWYGITSASNVIFKFDSTASDVLDYTPITLPSTDQWNQIATDGSGTWVVQGDNGLAYSTDDGDTFSAVDWANDILVDHPGHEDTGINDGRQAVTFAPLPRTLFWDGAQFVMYGWATVYTPLISGFGGVGWKSPDGSTWTFFDVDGNGGLAYQNGSNSITGLIPARMTRDRDRQGRYVFMDVRGTGSNFAASGRESWLGVNDDSEGSWNDLGYETQAASLGGTTYYAPIPFVTYNGYQDYDRYGVDVNVFEPTGQLVHFNSHFKTDGSNVMMVYEKSSYARSIYKFNVGHWGPTTVYNTESEQNEKPWPVKTVGTNGTANYPNMFYPQEVIFTGDYWLAVGGWKNVDSGYTIEAGYEFAYAKSIDGNVWTVTRVANYRTDQLMDTPENSVPEVWDLVFDGRYVWYFGRDVSTALAHGSMDVNCVVGRFDTTDDTWIFDSEGSGEGFGHAVCAYNLLNSFIYTDISSATIEISPEEADTHYGIVMRPSTALSLGGANTLDFRNIRGTGSIYLSANTELAKFNSISFSSSNIKISQKNLLLTETEIVKVKGMPLGVGGRFAQLNHYVRNVYGDHPVAYLPLNDVDQDISGTPENSETDDLQQEVF